MYCSECRFFSDLGRCRNGATRRGDVGYFQKACKFAEPLGIMEFPELLQEGVKIVPIPPNIEQKPLKIEQAMTEKVINLPEKVEELNQPAKTKTCADCGRELPLESFQRNTKGERISVCKDCMARRRREGKNKGKSPEQKLMEAVEVRLEKVAELCKPLTDADLAAELRRRGFSGKLTKCEELNV